MHAFYTKLCKEMYLNSEFQNHLTRNTLLHMEA